MFSLALSNGADLTDANIFLNAVARSGRDGEIALAQVSIYEFNASQMSAVELIANAGTEAV